MITLTTTWNPRGELPRLQRCMSLLKEVYQQAVVVLPPITERALVNEVETLGMMAVIPEEWSWGRFLALRKALESGSELIHYVDLDRLIRWVELREDEWRRSVDLLTQADCVCFGRTLAAYATHPKALQETEATSNRVISHLLGREMDVSAGSKGFTRQAAAFLDAHTQPGASMGMDAAWLVLLNRAGYRIKYVEVDGLDWESADQFRMEAADAETQRQAAAEYDADARHWEWRAKVADEVVKTGIWAANLPLEARSLNPRAHFEVEDYLHFYRPNLTEERADAEVNAIVRLLELEQAVDILDLACGYGRHTNRLAARGQRMSGVDIEAGFLELAQRQAEEMGLRVNYQQADMRAMDYDQEFDVVLLLFTAFGYFEDAENLAVLRNIQKALRPGGRFLVDIPNQKTFVEHLPPAFVDEVGQDLMINRGAYDDQARRWYNRRVVIRNGVRKDKPFYVRLYDEAEIRCLLEEAGMETVQIYSGWNGEALGPESRRMIILARKPDNINETEQK
jgi:2-polyprenyl-3-methyl-5-hydroxy-6-metoxy-1,4-benzoquinol methylase